MVRVHQILNMCQWLALKGGVVPALSIQTVLIIGFFRRLGTLAAARADNHRFLRLNWAQIFKLDGAAK